MSGYAFRAFVALTFVAAVTVAAGVGWVYHWNVYTNLLLTLGAGGLFTAWCAAR